jgi:eight-cysteine-cluster-containing protein
MNWARIVFPAGLLILLGASTSVATAEQHAICEGLSGAAFGLCTAAMNAGCDDEETRKPGCTKIEKKFEEKYGSFPPWVSPYMCKRPDREFDDCGGIAGFVCATGEFCADDPFDACDPDAGGADCGGVCVIGSPEQCPRWATVSPVDLYYSRFEGLFDDFDNTCLTDADAFASGCSGEVCASEPVITTCEALPYQPEGQCLCINGEAQWGAETSLLP